MTKEAAAPKTSRFAMTSILRNIAERLTPNVSGTTTPREDGFRTAKTVEGLFLKTRPEIDGEDCTHDCESCTIHLPKKFSIDEDDKLYGHVKGFSRHLIVATGKTDWVRDVEDEEGSVMEAMGKHVSKVEGGRLMLSASNMTVPEHADSIGPYGKDRPTSVLLLPAFTFVDNVTPNHVPELIESVINTTPTNTTPLDRSANVQVSSDPSNLTRNLHQLRLDTSKTLPAGLNLRACPHKYVVLLCSQATRDARCGQSAPLIRKELERHLRPLGLFRDMDDPRPGGCGVFFISHVGGHKYSANMMVYRREEPRRTVKQQMSNSDSGDSLIGGEAKDLSTGEAAQCIWLARVRPEDCENIVRYTILQGKVVKPERQLRGGFDRSKQLVSW